MVMPRSATSSATVLVRPAMPCLAATYADLNGLATSACAEATLMMRPHPRAFIAGSARRMSVEHADLVGGACAAAAEDKTDLRARSVLSIANDRSCEGQGGHASIRHSLSECAARLPNCERCSASPFPVRSPCRICSRHRRFPSSSRPRRSRSRAGREVLVLRERSADEIREHGVLELIPPVRRR